MTDSATASFFYLFIALAGWTICAAWLWNMAAGFRSIRAAPRIFPQEAPTDAPFVSVLVPARDEEANIAACLRSLSAQTYPSFEIIAVDDGSRDRTFELIEAAAHADSRIVPLRAPPTPPGWLGKSAALAFGARRARGQWLLFTDADTVHQRHALASAIAHACRRKLDLLSMLPRAETGSLLECILQPATMGWYGLWFPLDRVNSPQHAAAFANGQFLLIHADAYRTIGGHAVARSQTMEDLTIARAAKQAGLRIECALGKRIFSVRMYDSARRYWRGWRRILTHSFDARWRTLLAKAAQVASMSVAPPLLLLVTVGLGAAGGASGPLWIAAVTGSGLATLLALAFAGKANTLVGAPVLPALSYPLAGIVVTALLLDSARHAATGATMPWR